MEFVYKKNYAENAAIVIIFTDIEKQLFYIKITDLASQILKRSHFHW